MFSVPEDSDPPSTPIGRRSLASNPSTTPAGPPPSFREPPSFTPAGAPPSTVFGSSQYGSSLPKPSTFGGASARNSLMSRAISQQQKLQENAGKTFGGNSFAVPPSSPPQVVNISDDEEEEYSDEEELEEVEDAEMEDDEVQQPMTRKSGLYESTATSAYNNTPKGAKRSRQGDLLDVSTSLGQADDLPDIKGIARGLIASQGAPKLMEPDPLVLQTEKIVEKLYDIDDTEDPLERADIATQVAQGLRRVWAPYGKMSIDELASEEVGPQSKDSAIAKANFLASLLLQLYQPSSDEPQKSPATAGFGPPRSSAIVLLPSRQTVQIPKLLFDWLDTYHDPGARILGEVLQESEGYAASDQFWDAIYSNLFRGRFLRVIKLLEEANFAITGPNPDAGAPNYGYTDTQLYNIDNAINDAIRLLQSSPAVRDNNWDFKGYEWRIFRSRVEGAIEKLRESADAEGDLRSSEHNDFGRSSRFGQSSQFGLSESTRRAETGIPYELFEGLLNTYNTLLGKKEDLLPSSFSWVEGTLGLAAWWDGEEMVAQRGSLAASRRSLMRSQQSRPADVTPALAYRQRLQQTFVEALREGGDEESLDETFDTTSPMHIGLACILVGEVSSAIDIIKGYSITLAAALTELGIAAGWLADSTPAKNGLLDGFDNSDLMVLNYGQSERTTSSSKKDEILSVYADLVVRKPSLRESDHDEPVWGWMIALNLLSRIDDFVVAESRISDILDNLPLGTSTEVDRLLNFLRDLDLDEQLAKVAERYADSLVDKSLRESRCLYGDALVFYARAKQPRKMKDVLDMLNAMSLLHSTAYPPAAELDERLQTFLNSPQEALDSLAEIDLQAADYISRYLSGYANLREFYRLRDLAKSEDPKTSAKRRRDEIMEDGPGTADIEDDGLPPAKRKREAATCLLAAIDSAGDSIRGGLYDPEAEAVMQVDGLIVLLGEALPFINQSPRILGLSDLHILLRAAEDIQTIGAKIYNTADAFLSQTISNFYKTSGSTANGSTSTNSLNAGPSPRSLLRKSASVLTASSSGGFSLVGSSLLNSQELAASGGSLSTNGSGVLVKGEVQRGWDWRKGMNRDASGTHVLSILRVAVAQEVARAWAAGEGEKR